MIVRQDPMRESCRGIINSVTRALDERFFVNKQVPKSARVARTYTRPLLLIVPHERAHRRVTRLGLHIPSSKLFADLVALALSHTNLISRSRHSFTKPTRLYKARPCQRANISVSFVLGNWAIPLKFNDTKNFSIQI